MALVTGSGLKDVGAVQKAVQIPRSIKSALQEVKKTLCERGEVL